ncbi:MAG: flagellar basal-body MS-ring/collar protein FliF [Bacillota bacterium]|nr:flagellar basal-body MS-ring/collar protein FliF [Bacillota bacterium]
MNNLREKLKQQATKIVETWNQIGLTQKLLIGAGGLFLIIALVIFVSSNHSRAYEVLYSDLGSKDAQAIVEKLEEGKIDYRLDNNGKSILVDPAVKYRTRLILAGENLPRGESGFELFQENKFGETQTDKKVKYQIALQGELARTIQSLEDVKSARVHLVLPEKTLFSDEEEKPSAAVAITTSNGEGLSSKEVQGIINLIANSIESLSPEDVVIVDHNGNLLTDNVGDASSQTTNLVQSQLAMKSQFEKEKAATIQTMLDKTLGKDHAVVRVSADLIFDQQEETAEEYTHDPEGPFVRNEHVVSESGANQDSTSGGVDGIDANVPQYAETDTGESTSSYERSDKTRNYEINKTQTFTQYEVGKIDYEHLTVSVLVNKSGTADSNMDEEKVRSIVATAVGLKDSEEKQISIEKQISVAFIDFYSEPEPVAPQQAAITKLLGSPLEVAGVVAGLLLFVLAIILIVGRRKKKEEQILHEEMEKAEFEAVVNDEISIEDLFEKNLTPEEKEKQKIKAEIDKVIEENPESAAQVIRTWLLED